MSQEGRLRNTVFNNVTMDAAQKLIYREIGIESTFQCLLSSRKKLTLPF